MSVLVKNRLLATLPDQELEQFLGKGGPVHLHPGEVLYHSGEKIRYVYFPDQGLISLVATMMDGTTVETSIVGNEGMMGVPVFLGADSAPYRAVVQVGGKAWRIKSEAFNYEMRQSDVFHRRMLLYTQALMVQMSQMAACNCLHTVEERLCMLLLMIHDRMDSGEFFLTHEMIAEMLGARRAGITVAAGQLRQEGVISYTRGHIRILNRQQLELNACECYRMVKTEFDRLLQVETEPGLSQVAGTVQWDGSGANVGMNHNREQVRLA